MPASPRHPLDGVRVLDFTRVLAGPYLTMVLADLGADVIKVEHPKGGDDTRLYKPPEKNGESAYFLAVNRNKRSVAIDLQSPEGRDLARELAANSDILVQNFRADVMERLGLDFAALKAVNPRLIYASISGYGQTGPYRLVAGYDQIAQGEGGLQWMTGHPDGEPVRAAASIADTFTGLHCGMAILAALRARDLTGQGQEIDLALLDTVIAVTSFQAQGALVTGRDPARPGNASAIVVPTGLYPCADGKFNLLVGNDRQFRRLCEDVLEQPELADDPRFATNAGRQANAAALDAVLIEAFSARGRDEWIGRCRAAGVPAGALRSPVEALDAPEPAARGLVQEIDHPVAGRVRTVGTPIRMSPTPPRPAGPAPLLGEHTDAVLREVLGLDASSIDRLRVAGVIR